MDKTINISIIIAVIIIGGAIILSSPQSSKAPIVILNNTGTTTNTREAENTPKDILSENVSVENSVQVIMLKAKGGYTPRQSVALAGVPTIIRFTTDGTFDCSLSVRIPSRNLSQFLPQTGTTDIDIGVQPAGLFRGSCGMGMYPFEVDFK